MENWWLKTIDKKIKVLQAYGTEQVERYRISSTNAVLFNNKNF